MLLYELVFPIGLVAVSLVGLWVVPNLGWQWMFYIGALPAILALVLRALLPESPRWLAVHGRPAEADAALTHDRARDAEGPPGQPLPPVQPVVATTDQRASLSDLFGPSYLRRTLVVWVIWFAAYFINYGLVIWLTTIFRTVLQAAARRVAALRPDHPGGGLRRHVHLRADHRLRRTQAVFRGVLRGGRGQPRHAGDAARRRRAEQVLMHVAAAYFFISTINIGAYLYTPELYPTRSRALGVGTATAWLRFASMIGPTAVGFMIAGGLQSVFWMFATAALVAAVITAAFAIETKGRVLEEVSP